MKNPIVIDMDLDELKKKLLTMASHAETAVNEALRALIERDYELALRVKESDNVIDQLEVEIDDMAIHLLAKAPLASDLRLVTVAMKISQNLERVGDEATKIAKRARDLSQEPPVKVVVDLPRMAKLALDMLKAALDAFVNRDPIAARALIPRDKEVDGINKQVTNQLAQFMVENPDTIKRCLNLITVSRSLERIADHATNVAEEVVYLYEAQDIRHTGKTGAVKATTA
ncbi:MAG TPA: phosphate signaling complex protein PhoU [Verrucomicrobiae bacterium]|nr:phosphate signaling complex protein PhoU [Verrucomicrobiae bacterium]